MAQFLRPDGDITTTGITGTFASIDETSASDSDFLYGADGGGNVYECSLSNPSGTPANGSITLRVRLAEIDGGSLGNGSGNANPITVEIYEGATQRFTSSRSPGGSWTTYSSATTITVTNWNDLRVRVSDTSHGGNPNSRRAMGVSWIELEAADAAPPALQGAAAMSGSGTFSASGIRKTAGASALSGAGSLAATATLRTQGAASLSGAGSLSANGSVGGQVLQGSVALSGSGAQAAKPSLIARAGAALSGASTATASGVRKLAGALMAAGSGAVSATARMTMAARAALSGQGGLSAKPSGGVGAAKRAAKDVGRLRSAKGFRRVRRRDYTWL